MIVTINQDNISTNNSYPLIIFLMGPTASGKTSLAIALKKKLNVQIISVDSALVYKGMDIGTSKPLVSELKYAPHKLIDIRDPSECYSVADFYYDAVTEIKKIVDSGCIPLLVGGTMLYFKILLQGLYNVPKSNREIRDYLESEAQKKGWINMYNKLRDIDPITSYQIHYNDHKRIIRALEIFFISGMSWSELKKSNNSSLRYRVLQFAMIPENRKVLYDKIEQRFHHMLKIGFENEVYTLFKRPDLKKGLTSSILCVGYRQMWEYLSGNISYYDMIYQSIHSTRKLAKRQLTWLRKWPHIFWLNDDHNISAIINSILTVLSKIKILNISF